MLKVAVQGTIEVDPEKLGGTPVFPGTRVPIRNLFDSLEQGESLDEFLDQYPTVERSQVVAVLETSKETLLQLVTILDEPPVCAAGV